MGLRQLHREVKKSLTLFATHYFELTELPQYVAAAHNLHLKAREHNGKVVFLYQVLEGPANQSYGVQVAKLAGIPDEFADSKTKAQFLEEHSNSSPKLICLIQRWRENLASPTIPSLRN